MIILLFRVWAPIYGQMVGNTKVCGRMVNKMDRENIYYKMEARELGYGMMVKEYNG